MPGPVLLAPHGACSRREVVSSELVEVMVGKERKGRGEIDGHRINGRLSFIHMLWPVALDLGCGSHLFPGYMVLAQAQ